MIKQGKIGVTTENIFPIIKQFLYSDQEIFLRELVSNAVDATQKLKALERSGEFEGELGDLAIKVKVDKDKGTLTVSDRGIGMTAEEVDKYINQIAFTSANEFLQKYKDKIDSIIGRFGLGFYSAFMVADKVELITKSWREDAPAVKWVCEGEPEFRIEQADKQDRGTDVVLYISDDAREYLDDSRIEGLLKKYSRFLPVEIKMITSDGKEITITEEPLWKRNPSELKHEDYIEFYKKLYPDAFEDPLFYIHLNVDYPFNLTGILYFPKIRSNLEIQKNKIQLYANQVFVTDSVENIVPEFLTLLHGVIDSPDIPLNVSRSYLQTDANVRKISNHITKKVADKLHEIFKENRKEFEQKWDDLRLFIQYGMMTEEKFYEKMKDVYLLKNVDDKYFTLEEYKQLIKDSQTDKYGTLVYLYATDKQEQHSFIQDAKDKGYDVLLLDGALDIPFINFLEQKLDQTRFARVDSDIIDNLILKDDKGKVDLDAQTRDELATVFESAVPSDLGVFTAQFEALGKEQLPVIITQSEYMRRMKDIGMLGGPHMSLYDNLPNNYNLVINTNHSLISKVIDEINEKLGDKLQQLRDRKKEIEKQIEELREQNKDKKEEEIPFTEREKLDNLNKDLEGVTNDIASLLKEYASESNLVKQIVDLALLSRNMLKGEKLTQFVRRSVQFIE